MVDEKPIMDQVHEYEYIKLLVRDETMWNFTSKYYIEKFPSTWNNYCKYSTKEEAISKSHRGNFEAIVVVFEANLVENKHEWVLDTRAPRHFFFNKALMEDFEEVKNGEHVYKGK